MSPQLRHISLTAGILAFAAFLICNISVAQSGTSVTWTSLVNSTTTGSSLTPTAASGHAESSQTISSGNGSLSIAAWSYGDGNHVTFGLINGTFTGSPSEIDYGWRSYGDVANCRYNGDSLNTLISVSQGDTLEVRINGTTVEYYHNSTLVYSLTGQSLSYPYRAAATFTANTSPVITSATMTGTGGSVKTDRAVYPVPSPLPSPPPVGGYYTDPVFGTTVLRVTDQNNCPAPGCGTYYPQWPTFNADNTRILIRVGTSGNMMIKQFDPVNFTVGTTVRSNVAYGCTSLDWQTAIWSRTDPDTIYVHPGYYDSACSNSGMKELAYHPSTNTFELVHDFAADFGSNTDYLFEQHCDKSQDIWTFMQNRVGAADNPISYIIWRRSTNTILLHINAFDTRLPEYGANNAAPDKTGRWVSFASNFTPSGFSGRMMAVWDTQTNTWQYIHHTGAEDDPHHGYNASGFTVGRGDWSGAETRRPFSNLTQSTVLFDWRDSNGVRDWSGDHHVNMYADNETWALIAEWRDPSVGNYTGAFENELFFVNTQSPQQIIRFLHHLSLYNPAGDDDTQRYWATPKPSISKDSKYVAYTSNWGNSGRTDLYIVKVPPLSTSGAITWTNLVNATTSNSSLTPTAATGRGETVQSIASGNGSLKFTATSNYDGGFVQAGLLNSAFTGSLSELDYSWRTYGSAAVCHANGDNISGIFEAVSGDTFEVRISGTTVQWYQNTILRCSLTGQTLLYPYHAAALFSGSSSQSITSTLLQ
jgi:hypothetical protein